MKPNESIPIRTLRNDVSRVMQRVEHGESFDVTRHGRTIGHLTPTNGARRWKTTAEFCASVAASPADPEFLALLGELRAEPMRDSFDRWEERE